MGKLAFLFPGQGSQTVGMGQTAAEGDVRVGERFNEADQILGYSLSKLCFTGPEDELRLTANAQPALLTTSVSLLPFFADEGIVPDYVAGHSLGEYSALVAAGAISFKDALTTVRQRGLLMEEAVPAGQGAMSAIVGLEREAVEKVCQEVKDTGAIVEPANYNCPGQIVISGEAKAVATAGEGCRTAGARRVLPLSVSGPFHSSLMQPAAKRMEAVLQQCDIQDASVPVVANVSARPVQAADEIRHSLVKQVAAPVLWEDGIRRMIADGVDTFIEIGSGNVLTGLVRKVDRKAVALSVQDQDSFTKALDRLS
ncbi:[acyl-carrier-protein] S-malonyltransferase [Marininema mesophilum]|uniref:Malonyl CoA-acyl carrier protein transacylase n=1 Tax=Marininema mesophilum TaxID=1048340 RepID=A0A1H2Q259_9BACL|nr:ACP S-malonyltransferase [Marininema mesophilum]SDW01237.1 [acyl-carrier-protein] S-malonyltransferase [Marininema mesophilum]